MAVFRVPKIKDYTIMSNHHLKNGKLSLKAKGLLSLMLSLPESWDYTLQGLAVIARDGISSIRSAVKELEEHGYLERRRNRNTQGQLTDTEYIIKEQPDETGDEAGELEKEQPAKSQEYIENRLISESRTQAKQVVENDYEDISGQENCAQVKQTEANGCRDIQQEQPICESYTQVEHAMVDDFDGTHVDVDTREQPICDFPTLDNPVLEKPMLDFPTLENPTYENRTQLITNKARTKELNTHAGNIHQSIYPSIDDARDRMDEIECFRRIIKRNIEYDILLQQHGVERLDMVVELLTETITSQRMYIQVNCEEVPADVVKQRLLGIDAMHVEYVFGKLDSTASRIRNIRSYLLTALYNARVTMDEDIRAQVNYDFYGEEYD